MQLSYYNDISPFITAEIKTKLLGYSKSRLKRLYKKFYGKYTRLSITLKILKDNNISLRNEDYDMLKSKHIRYYWTYLDIWFIYSKK